MMFEAMRASGLVEQIREELRRAVLSGRLAPGSVIRESVMAAEMQVSRAPVREALRLLEESGLVEKSQNRPYRVASFTQDDLVDLASMRIALEELAVRLVIGQDPDLGPTRIALEQMRTAAGDQSTYEIIAADRTFHETLVQAAGNRRLNAAYSRLRDQIELAILTNVTEDAMSLEGIHARHADLLDMYVRTVAEGDPSILLPELERHVAGGMGVPVPERWPPIVGKRADTVRS